MDWFIQGQRGYMDWFYWDREIIPCDCCISSTEICLSSCVLFCVCVCVCGRVMKQTVIWREKEEEEKG